MKRKLRKTLIAFVALLTIMGAAFALLPLPGYVPVLMYHFIGNERLEAEYGNFVSQSSFAWQMAFLHFFKYRIISLDELYEIKTGKRKPRGREIVLTFDDGNYTFDSLAVPVLKRYEFPVTVFMVSESVKGGTYGSMNTEALQRLRAYDWISFASHSKTHPFLSKLTEDSLREELFGSKRDLETMLGKPVRDLAYPSGDLNPAVVSMAREAGYRMAFSTSPKKTAGLEKGFYTMTRVKISSDCSNLFVFWIKISGIYPLFKELREDMKTYFRNKSG